MSFTVYILFSESLNKYYTGYTSTTLEVRLQKHNSIHSGYTGKATDWTVIHKQSLDSKTDALQLERKIKKRGAKRFLDALPS